MNALKLLACLSGIYSTAQGACSSTMDRWPLSQCNALIAGGNIDRCTSSSTSSDYFKFTLCCSACAAALGSNSGAQPIGDIKNCKDNYSKTICKAVVAGKSVWTCNSAGQAFCRKSCGFCSTDYYKTDFPCKNTAACTALNYTSACNANGATTYKCDTKTSKCQCPSSAVCDLTQAACASDSDCISTRESTSTAATALVTAGCSCHNSTKKCYQATCSVGAACTSAATTPATACSSDKKATIAGCVCADALKCAYYAPVCMLGTDCGGGADAAAKAKLCMSDDMDGTESGCACNAAGKCEKDGSSTAMCNTANVACTNDASCSTDATTVVANCHCNEGAKTFKTCGAYKYCAKGKTCTKNTDCMSDGSDGTATVRTNACSCFKGVCFEGDTATATNGQAACLYSANSAQDCDPTVTDSAKMCSTDGKIAIDGCTCDATSKMCKKA